MIELIVLGTMVFVFGCGMVCGYQLGKGARRSESVGEGSGARASITRTSLAFDTLVRLTTTVTEYVHHVARTTGDIEIAKTLMGARLQAAVADVQLVGSDDTNAALAEVFAAVDNHRDYTEETWESTATELLRAHARFVDLVRQGIGTGSGAPFSGESLSMKLDLIRVEREQALRIWGPRAGTSASEPEQSDSPETSR